MYTDLLFKAASSVIQGSSNAATEQRRSLRESMIDTLSIGTMTRMVDLEKAWADSVKGKTVERMPQPGSSKGFERVGEVRTCFTIKCQLCIDAKITLFF